MARPSDDDGELLWQAPPEGLRLNANPGRYAKLARQLRERPEQWAVIPTDSTNRQSLLGLATNIRTGKVKGFEPPRAFEALFDTENMTLYARYVGEPDAEG